MSITSTIKEELSKGTSKEVILEKIKSMTKNPNAWSMKSIEKIESSINTPKKSEIKEKPKQKIKYDIPYQIKNLKLSKDEEIFLSILISNTNSENDGMEISQCKHLFSFKPTPVLKKLKKKKIVDTLEIGSLDPHLPIVFLTPKYFKELNE